MRRDGGTGRRGGLKILWPERAVGVRFSLPALKINALGPHPHSPKGLKRLDCSRSAVEVVWSECILTRLPMMRNAWPYLVALVWMVACAPSTSDDPPSSCAPASVEQLSAISDGLIPPVKTLTNGFVMDVPAGQRFPTDQIFPGWPQVLIGGRMQPGDQIGIWGLGNARTMVGPLAAVNPAARDHSEWGAGAKPGSPMDAAMIRLAGTRQAAQLEACIKHAK
jgi:hypothetical protein